MVRLIPESIIAQHNTLLVVERNGCHRSETEIVIGLMERSVIDVMELELLDHAFKRLFVGNADKNDRRREVFLRALRKRVCHLKCRVIGLHELCSDRKVLADEDEKVTIYLVHERYLSG